MQLISNKIKFSIPEQQNISSHDGVEKISNFPIVTHNSLKSHLI